MKRIITSTLVFAATVAFCQLQAQQLSLFGSVGYGFGIGGADNAGVDLASVQYDNAAHSNIVKRDDNYLNYGAGMKIDLGANYAIMEHVALQGGLSYTAGTPKLRVKTSYPGYEQTLIYSHNSLGIKILVLPSFRVIELLDVHIGVGLGLYFAGTSIEGESTRAAEITNDGKIDTRPTFGFCGQAGVDYPMTDKLALFGDINFETLRFTAQAYESTTSNTTVHYVRNSSANNEFTPPKLPGTNWSFRVGVKFAVL